MTVGKMSPDANTLSTTIPIDASQNYITGKRPTTSGENKSIDKF